MPSVAGLRLDYYSLQTPGLASPQGLLGVAAFAERDMKSPLPAEIPWIPIRMPVLGGPAGACEIWRTDRPARSGELGELRYRHDGEVLFGCICVPEPRVAPVTATAAGWEGPATAFSLTTEAVYRRICTALAELGYPHLLRVWNYLADINAVSHGLERYRQFNSARRAALRACGRHTSGSVPAACALGALPGSPLAVYFLAVRSDPLLIENPRQVSAYQYPTQYGPQPAFSRASALAAADGTMLFISGTASIVGHETRHRDDVAAQTRETLLNLAALLEEANRRCPGAPFDLGALSYKVYLRHATDLPQVQAQLQGALGAEPSVLFLQADVCREELLVEMEAVGSSPR